MSDNGECISSRRSCPAAAPKPHQDQELLIPESAGSASSTPQFNSNLITRVWSCSCSHHCNRATRDLLHRHNPSDFGKSPASRNTAIQRMTSSAELTNAGIGPTPGGHAVLKSVQNYETAKANKQPVGRLRALLGKIIVSCNAWIKKNPRGSKWGKNKSHDLQLDQTGSLRRQGQSAIKPETRVRFRPRMSSARYSPLK